MKTFLFVLLAISIFINIITVYDIHQLTTPEQQIKGQLEAILNVFGGTNEEEH